MINAKNSDLMKLHHMYHSMKQYCRPYSRSVAFIIPANHAVQNAPIIPANMLNITRNGIMVISPNIFGRMRYDAEFIPIISSASICCVTLIVPISEAMFEPTLPARIRHMMDEENSSNRISRVVYPTTKRGIQGLSMFNFIWIQITAPMKKEISRTMPIEFMPNWYNSFTYCLKYTLILSGREKTLPIRIMYLPRILIGFIMSLL